MLRRPAEGELAYSRQPRLTGTPRTIIERFESVASLVGRLAIRLWVWFVYAFLLSPFLVVALFSLDERRFARFPLSKLSFHWYQGIPRAYMSAFWVSVALGIAASLVAAFLGVTAGLALTRAKFRGDEVVKGLFRAPLQVPTIVTGVVFLQFYYLIAAAAGIRLVETFTGLLLAHLILALPFVVGVITGMLASFPIELEEAAWGLGASPFATLRRVILPLMKPGIGAGALYAFVTSFGNVPVSLFLVGPRFTTLPILTYTTMEFDYDPRLLPVSTLVVLISAFIIWGIQKLAGLGIVTRTRSTE